ncbi:MAG: DUF4173 domain-containing protein [Lachnospiraceae bacterium]|nr:DUF4173 domain-containing protein [Lachnospiraceae bacterium]
MDNNNMIGTGLPNQQALVSAPKISDLAAQEAKMNEMRKKEKRFHTFGAGCFLYALFYTFCLYHNASGITYPFFAGGTLWFFGCFIKKSGNSSADAKDNHTAEHINSKFLMAAILVAGALNCTTDSGVLIFFNKLLMFVLLSVLLLQSVHNLTGWKITAYIKGTACMLFGGICRVFAPIEDLLAVKYQKRASNGKNKNNDRNKRILCSVGIGLVISMPIVMLLLILLGSADAVFYKLMCDTLSFCTDFNVAEGVWKAFRVALWAAAAFAVSYGILAYNTDAKNIKKIDDMAKTEKINWDVYIAITVNLIICVIYVIFSGVQIFGLFLRQMSLPEGYTYASYARHGFFELVFVCLFNIILVLYTLAYFQSSKLLRTLLTMICGCTYIMTISSAYRMLLYIASYQLTFLRLFVLWALLMITIVMGGVTAYIYNTNFSLFRYMLMVLTVGWLVFSALHPDYWIAGCNIKAGENGAAFDHYYLRKELSLDAVAALPPEFYRDEDSGYYRRAEQYQDNLDEFLGIRKFNVSRAYASDKIGIK